MLALSRLKDDGQELEEILELLLSKKVGPVVAKSSYPRIYFLRGQLKYPKFKQPYT